MIIEIDSNRNSNSNSNSKYIKMITKKSSKKSSKKNKVKNSKNKHKKVNKITQIKNKNLDNVLYLDLSIKQIEFMLMYSSIINHLLLLIRKKIPSHIIKKTIINLFKDLRNHNNYINKNTTDNQLDIIFIKLYNQSKQIHKKFDVSSNKRNSKNINKTFKGKGGFYFKSLEEKRDQPLTGNDLATLLDEIQQFIYNAQYTEEGQFLQDTNAILSMFRGDIGQFKGLVKWRILPKYISIVPPFLNWKNIKDAIDRRKYEDIPDYLLAYQSYLRSRDEYLVAKGLKSPKVLGKDRYVGFFDKLAHSLDVNIQKFQQYRNMATGNMGFLTGKTLSALPL
jgi:hypothetical protein